MGMGRNLYRRTSLIILIFLSAAFLAASENDSNGTDDKPIGTVGYPVPLPFFGDSRHSRSKNDISPDVSWIPPRQGRSAPKAWSVSPKTLQWERPEVALWKKRWESPEGRAKLIGAQNRYKAFRIEVEGMIRDSGIPWEFAALPVVESNWRINAVSSSGAAGPWQFLRASAIGRGLIIDAWRDERRDVWKSTEAAMAELSFYHRLFSDWLMAIASYNAGPTRMRKLMGNGEYSGYWDLYDAHLIPSETENYVPQVMAVAYITAHAGRTGLPIEWTAPPRWTRIRLNHSVPLDSFLSVASENGTERTLLRQAHSELHHPFTPPPGMPYSLKVPAEKTEEVTAWLEGLKDGNLPDRFWRYTVRSGDTLSEIAERYTISLPELLSYNVHVASGMLRIGERLYIPGTETEPADVESDELPLWSGRYSVRPGDSFWSIAREYGTTPEKLAETNHRNLNGILTAGSVLNVPSEGEDL